MKPKYRENMEDVDNPFRHLGRTCLSEHDLPPVRAAASARQLGTAAGNLADMRETAGNDPFRYLKNLGGEAGWPPLSELEAFRRERAVQTRPCRDSPYTGGHRTRMSFNSAEWDELEHPRDEDGKFTTKGGGTQTAAKSEPVAPKPSAAQAGSGNWQKTGAVLRQGGEANRTAAPKPAGQAQSGKSREKSEEKSSQPLFSTGRSAGSQAGVTYAQPPAGPPELTRSLWRGIPTGLPVGSPAGVSPPLLAAPNTITGWPLLKS